LLDNFLGLLFGCLRGAFIISLGYLIMLAVVPKDNPPEWLKTSVTKNYVQKGADLLAQVAPRYLADIEGFMKKEQENAMQNQQGGTDSSQLNMMQGVPIQASPQQGSSPYSNAYRYSLPSSGENK
jgi:uncharacterized membrane protein required for colicin V production